MLNTEKFFKFVYTFCCEYCNKLFNREKHSLRYKWKKRSTNYWRCHAYLNIMLWCRMSCSAFFEHMHNKIKEKTLILTGDKAAQPAAASALQVLLRATNISSLHLQLFWSNPLQSWVCTVYFSSFFRILILSATLIVISYLYTYLVSCPSDTYTILSVVKCDLYGLFSVFPLVPFNCCSLGEKINCTIFIFFYSPYKLS